jgi:hypothetical protein
MRIASIRRNKDMTIKKRWIDAVVETAEKNETQLPWARGTRRQQTIENRKAEKPAKRSA